MEKSFTYHKSKHKSLKQIDVSANRNLQDTFIRVRMHRISIETEETQKVKELKSI